MTINVSKSNIHRRISSLQEVVRGRAIIGWQGPYGFGPIHKKDVPYPVNSSNGPDYRVS